MQVKEIMTAHPGFGTPDTSMQEIARMMVENDCGCIPIVESGDTKKPIGTITDRDIVIRTIAENKNPLDLQAGDIMSDDVVTVSPETSVEECGNLMESSQIRRIVVVDDAGNLCGMVAQADIAVNAPTHTTADLVEEVSKGAGNS